MRLRGFEVRVKWAWKLVFGIIMDSISCAKRSLAKPISPKPY